MSKFSNSDKVLSFRQFDKLNGNTYVAYEFAWPVDVVECYANKVSDGALNALAEATLELLVIPEMSQKRIAELLNVSVEVIVTILKDLSSEGYYDNEKKIVNQQGKEYIEKKETGVFQEEKVFGNIFVSRIDGEVFPYFHEGNLPWGQRFSDLLYLSFDGEEVSSLDRGKADVLDRVNRSFHKYGRISKSSKEQMRSHSDRQDIDFIEEELYDRSFSDKETFADFEERKNLEKARIMILKTERKEVYIRCRFCVSKVAPEKFIVDSPFPSNITSWYSESFHRMRSNNELIYGEDNKEISLDFFCENVTKQFYIDFPEMQGTNFEQFVKIQFPSMLSCSISKVCLDKYKEVFNLNLLCDDKMTVKRHTVINESAKSLELILNNYIHRLDKSSVVSRYENGIINVLDINELLLNFGIKKCTAKNTESKKVDRFGNIIRNQSIMTHFRGVKQGFSIAEKYYFLIIDSYFNEKSLFRKLLLNEGVEIISMLDNVNHIRNSYGAHNDGIQPPEIPNDEYSEFQINFKKATKILLDYID